MAEVRPPFEHIEQDDQGTDPEANIVIPAEKLILELRMSIERNTGSKNRHDRKRDRVESAGTFIETKLQILRYRSGFGTVVEGYHEDR